VNYKNTDKTLIIEHVINRLFTLQLNQALKLSHARYWMHQALDQAHRLHQYIQGNEIRNSGKIYGMKSIYGQENKPL